MAALDTINGNNSQPHICSDCGRSYKAAETLNRHRKNHLASSQYPCHICEATFKRKDLLDRHLQIHANSSLNGRRRRGQRACVRCSRLKTRCDSSLPCTRCAQGRHDCVYKSARGTARTDSIPLVASPSESSNEAFPDNGQGEAEEFLDPLVETAASCADLSAWTTTSVDWSQCWPDVPGPRNRSGSLGQGSATSMPFSQAILGSSTVDGPDHQMRDVAPCQASNELSSGLGWTAPSSLSACLVTEPLVPLTFPYEQPKRQYCRDSSCNDLEPSSRPYQMCDESTVNNAYAQAQVINEMMQHAMLLPSHSSYPDERLDVWRMSAERIETVFGIRSERDARKHLLDHFLTLFHDNFDVNWPIIFRHRNTGEIAPHLYVVMTAIGAIWDGQESGEYHLQMIEALRTQLLFAAFKPVRDDTASLALCQSLALLQAIMLFTGNRKSFRNAHELGIALIAVADRISLFDEVTSRSVQEYLERSPTSDTGNATKDWVEAESRRRLAVGIMRLEAFLSMLVGSRPQVSYEDVRVRIPVPVSVWQSESLGEQMWYRNVYDHPDRAQLSTAVLTALERDQALSQLRADELEHVLYGLQHRVWRFSQDPKLLHRQSLDLIDDQHSTYGQTTELSRLVHALRTWKAAMKAAVLPTEEPSQRTTIFNSQLLYSVTIMKLRSDLPAFHRLALAATRDEQLPQNEVSKVILWANSPSGRVTAQHSLSVRSMVNDELGRPQNARAYFTIIPRIALLNAALAIWVYIGARDIPQLSQQTCAQHPSESLVDMQLRPRNNAPLMQCFTELLEALQPLHPGISTKLRSYHTTIAALTVRPFTRSPSV
jgi:hypothetical protein